MNVTNVDEAVSEEMPTPSSERSRTRRALTLVRKAAGRLFRFRLPYNANTLILALLLAVITPIAAWSNSRSQTPIYGAQAEVLANGSADAPNAAQFEAAVATQRFVMESRAVLEPVAITHGLDVADLEEAISVKALTGSTVLQVTVEDENAQVAVDVVNSIVQEYLGLAPDSASDEATLVLGAERDRLKSERETVERDLRSVEEANAQAETLPGVIGNPTQERRLSDESAELLRRIGAVEERLSELAIEELEPKANAVVSPPFVLPDPVSPDPVQAAALGMFVGLALAGTFVLIRAQLAASRRNAEVSSAWDALNQ